MTTQALALDPGNDAAPDERIVNGGVVEFGRLMTAWGDRNFAPLNMGELEQVSGLGRGKLRGLLHAGWSVGWVRPLRGVDGRIRAWGIDPAFCGLAEAYRRQLEERAQAMQRDLHEFTNGRVR